MSSGKLLYNPVYKDDVLRRVLMSDRFDVTDSL
jgi:hypothetical protein